MQNITVVCIVCVWVQPTWQCLHAYFHIGLAKREINTDTFQRLNRLQKKNSLPASNGTVKLTLSWWLQPPWKNMTQNGFIFPKFFVKKIQQKNLWNHHQPTIFCFPRGSPQQGKVTGFLGFKGFVWFLGFGSFGRIWIHREPRKQI